MAAGDSRHEMLAQLFESAGLKLSNEDLSTVGELYSSFAGQRARLSGAARPESEPMIVPAFDRVRFETEAQDEPTG